jgi:septum formation protein
MTDTPLSTPTDSLTLASTSPRRRELLEQLGLPFEVAEPTPDDDPADHRPAAEFARDLAARKAASVADAPAYAHRWVLGADTVVFDDAEILLKPADRREARRMLARLAGRTHRVVTALALFAPAPAPREPLVATDVTAVTFAPLSEAEIEWYLETNEWRGVAGAYRIQGRGAVLIERIEGSYSGVMGLPIRLLYSMLRDTGFRFP